MIVAKKMITKGSEEFQFFQDYYRFRMEFYDGEEKDDFWDSLISAGNSLANKYNGTGIFEYAKKMILAHMEDVERRFAKGEK